MSVGIMFSYFNKIKLKLCEKKAGLEPETDLFQATIMGTGKSIDFLYLFKVGYYPFLTFACTCCLNYIAVV